MPRGPFKPSDYGVDLPKNAFTIAVAESFMAKMNGLTVNELLFRPRLAVQFCDELRRDRAWWDIPDDVILRTLVSWQRD